MHTSLKHTLCYTCLSFLISYSCCCCFSSIVWKHIKSLSLCNDVEMLFCVFHFTWFKIDLKPIIPIVKMFFVEICLFNTNHGKIICCCLFNLVHWDVLGWIEELSIFLPIWTDFAFGFFFLSTNKIIFFSEIFLMTRRNWRNMFD